MIGLKIEYDISQKDMKINLEGQEENYYANLDSIQINPKIVNFSNLDIKKQGIKMDMNAPFIFNPENPESSSPMIGGIKFEGLDKNSFIEKIEETARGFGPEWDSAVKKRRDEITKRSQI